MECPYGEIQDLYWCGCQSLQQSYGLLVDFGVNGTIPQARIDGDAYFTVREWANGSDYEWEYDSNRTYECLTKIDEFADQWGRYRQASF